MSASVNILRGRLPRPTSTYLSSPASTYASTVFSEQRSRSAASRFVRRPGIGSTSNFLVLSVLAVGNQLVKDPLALLRGFPGQYLIKGDAACLGILLGAKACHSSAHLKLRAATALMAARTSASDGPRSESQ